LAAIGQGLLLVHRPDVSQQITVQQSSHQLKRAPKEAEKILLKQKVSCSAFRKVLKPSLDRAVPTDLVKWFVW